MKSTKFEHSYLLDFSYKNLKSFNFIKEKEKNYCTIIFWKNETRLLVLRGLLTFNHFFSFAKARRKQITIRYNKKKPSIGNGFIQFIISINDISLFLLFLFACEEAKTRYRYLKRDIIGVIYLFPFSGYKVKWEYTGKKPLFENSIYNYILFKRIYKYHKESIFHRRVLNLYYMAISPYVKRSKFRRKLMERRKKISLLVKK